MTSFAEIDVTKFPRKTQDALLAQLYSVNFYGRYSAKITMDYMFLPDTMPTEEKETFIKEKVTELLQVALALHIYKPDSTISRLKDEAQVLKDQHNVDIFPEVPDLAQFPVGVYTSIKNEASTFFNTHMNAIKLMFRTQDA